MRVLLKSNFFGPDGVLYVRDRFGTDVPDSFRDVLPPGTKLLDDDAPVAPVIVDAPATLRDFDDLRSAADAEEAVAAKAEAARVAGGRKPPRSA